MSDTRTACRGAGTCLKLKTQSYPALYLALAAVLKSPEHARVKIQIAWMTISKNMLLSSSSLILKNQRTETHVLTSLVRSAKNCYL